MELMSAQVSAVTVEAVGTYLFPVEKQAVGGISFEEDPAVVQAESALIAAAATYERTNKELARVKSLGDTNGIPQKELEQAISDRQTAQSALKAARDAVRSLGETDAEIDRMITTGTINSASLTRRSNKWALASIAEGDSPSIRVGQSVVVKVMAYPDRVFPGTVSRIYATADASTHRVAVRCEIADPANDLRAGMLADFVIRVQEPRLSTAIRESGAVREPDGTLTAWVTTDRRRFSQRTIKTGRRRDGHVQILEGLKPGELIASDGAIFLSNMLQAPPTD